MTKILVSLTTYNNPDWRKNIADIKKFGITEFAFFPTVIKTTAERMEIMQTIKKELGSISIPFCHVRIDVAKEELDYMIQNFGTKKFNIHMDTNFKSSDLYEPYRDMIYIENAGPRLKYGIDEKELSGFAGLCIDISHLENTRLLKAPGFANDLALAKKYPVGMNHISAISNTERYIEELGFYTYDRHVLSSLSEVDYIKQYYPDLFCEFAAIELYNSIESQIEIKKYIESLLGL